MSQVHPGTPAKSNEPAKKRVGELLVEEGLITAGQLVEALQLQRTSGGRVVENLVNLGFLAADQFAAFMGRQKGVASLNLSRYEVPAELCDLVPKEFALKYEVFPIDRMGRLLTVGMVVPVDLEVRAELEQITGLRVKAMLCSAADIRAAIQRYYPKDGVPPAAEVPIETTMKLESIARIIREMDCLPTLPETVAKVEQAVHTPNVSLRDVADIVITDPPISARLLRLANSAAFGLPNNVETVEMATALLGLKETAMVVLSSAVINLVERSKSFDYSRFWTSAIVAAGSGRVIAEKLNLTEKSGVFTAGLLHDIGRFALSEAAPARFAKLGAGLSGTDLVAEEERVLGIGHPEAGYELANHWGLPPEICDSIRFHHSPELSTEFRLQAKIVALSAVLAEAHIKAPQDAAALHALCGPYPAPLDFDAGALWEVYLEIPGAT